MKNHLRGISYNLTNHLPLLPLMGALAISLNLSLLTRAAWAETAIEVKIAKSNQGEDFERNVDQVALYSQEKSIGKLVVLAKKYRGQMQEPVMLAKLAELQQQRATIIFRILHGNANKSTKALDMSRYNKAMQESIGTLNGLIGKYPNFEEIAHAYFMRGKAYEEIKDKIKSEHDYLHLVSNFPGAEDTIAAYMSLADFAIDVNDHARAVGFLKEVEKHPDDTHYPFALYKLAWAHYNLKKIPETMGYAERHIAYYAPKKNAGDDSVDPTNFTSDAALRENTLLDSVVFYFEGYEEGSSKYTLNEALSYFRGLESGPVLGRMIVRFAKLLRSHNHDEDLITWKEKVLKSEPDRPESLDAVIVVYESQLNKRIYNQVVKSANDIAGLYANHKKFESFPKAQKMVLATAEGLQKDIVKNKGATDIASYSKALADIYDSFTRMVEETDPRIPRVHYNLAETLFTIKDYPQATAHYRWVVDHGRWPDKREKLGEANVPDASLKAIAARYEVLHLKNLIPKELAAKSLQEDTGKSLDPIMGEWVAWVDRHLQYSEKGTENFIFEAARALYSQGHIVESVNRLKGFSKKYPNSNFAIPSASLVIDTYITSANWEKTHELAQEFIKVPNWKTSEFAKRLLAVASDAYYKMVEAQYKVHNYVKALDLADNFIKMYPKSTRLGELLSVAGDAAMVSAEKDRALNYYSKLINDLPGTERAGVALLARGGVVEDRYQFLDAASDYRTYLGMKKEIIKLTPKEQDDLRKKVLALTWISGEKSELNATLQNKIICTEQMNDDCERYRAISILSSSEQSLAMTEDAFDKARKSSNDTKVIWAAIALEGSKSLAFRDRLVAVKLAISGWETLDPLFKFALVPHLSVTIPHAFTLDRAQMKEVAPLLAKEKWITHRVDMIHEMELAATKAIKLPWARIRAEVLSEIAGLYLDLSRGLEALPPPKDLSSSDLTAYEDTIRKLTVPFEEKGQDMRHKAFEIASRFAVEETSFKAIAEPFFAENPSQAKALKPLDTKNAPHALDLALLDQIDPDGKWDRLAKGKRVDESKPEMHLKALWTKALANKQFPQIAFFMQEAQEKALIHAGAMSGVKAVSLAAIGARGEALAELEDGAKDLKSDERKSALFTVLQYSLAASSKDHTQSLLKILDLPDQLNGDENRAVAQASVWAGVTRKPAGSATAAVGPNSKVKKQ